MNKLETVGALEEFEYRNSRFLQHCTKRIIINFSCNLCNGSFSKEFNNYEKGKEKQKNIIQQWENCLVIPQISVRAEKPGRRGVNLTVERAHHFQCFGGHVTPPPLDVEIFTADQERLQVEKNLTENEMRIYLSGLTPYQDYSLMLRARPSLDLSRTIYSKWLNITIHTEPDGQLALSRQ